MNVPTRATGCLTAARPIWALVLVGVLRVGFVPAARASADRSPSLEALLAAAAADGFVLGGSGNRSPEVTARLRVANGCPDVYDFTWQGQTICHPHSSAKCTGNAAFTWLLRQRSLVRLPQPAVRSLALVPERQMTTTPPTTHNARVVAKLAQIGPGVPS